ncbi:alpha/beta fold hydrolase [Streptomyces sp. NPDC047315]|uniref:thioesterase II family protein n=1 Tax=Streptomyces sp. NPDC047315 TaxID=3155142 RepID=UPI0033C45E37
MTTHLQNTSTTGLVVESPYIWRARRRSARHRLVCFPHAGSGASAFSGWAGLLGEEVEPVAVQLPGRQNRLLEDPPTEVPPMIEEIVDALLPLTRDLPYSFFGHSCGALLAYEVTHVLQARGEVLPRRLFVSAQPSPEEARKKAKLHHLSEEEFRAEVLRLGGFDEEVVEDEDALEHLLPTVLADFALWEQHDITLAPPLRAPMTALVGGEDHRAPQELVAGWKDHTSVGYDERVYPGGHFFVFDPGTDAEVLAYLTDRMLTS